MLNSAISSIGIKTIRDSLIKDFCVALSIQIILQNARKCNLNLANLDRESYMRLVDSIASDYRHMKPLGTTTEMKKNEWLAAMDKMDWHLNCQSALQFA